MKTTFNFLLTALLVAPLLIPHHSVHAQAEAADQISVLLIIDDSGSMETSDPADLRYTAARLFIALLEEGDAAGVITFATQSHWLTDQISTIHNDAEKHSLIDELVAPQATGYTDVKAAFIDAADALETLDPSVNQPVIVFLTDGDPEIAVPYPEYEAETLAVVERLHTPVYSIALTDAAQTPFLHQVAHLTSGVVIPAESAADLLDAYLSIFGQIKDRTVSGEGVTEVPGTAAFTIDPALAPFVENASFIIASQSVSSSVQANLIDPSGQLITGDTPGVDFAVMGDPGFVLLTVNQPAGGEWSFQVEGSGSVQARLVLHSRLRIQVELPAAVHPAGQAFPIRFALVEEAGHAETVRLIGQANFAAMITTPAGSQVVLDSFFDDGTHGDLAAEDGMYSRLFVDTQAAGVYSIAIQGWKGMVPVEARFDILVVEFPQLSILEPAQARISLHQSPLTLAVKEIGASMDEGSLVAQITAPSGNTDEISLQLNNDEYSGSYIPDADGTYTIIYITRDAVYLGVPFTATATTSITIDLIPVITFPSTPLVLGPVEMVSLEQGLAFSVPVTSTSRLVETIYPALSGLPGLSLQPGTAIELAPDQGTELSFVLRANHSMSPGLYQGRLGFSADPGVDLVNASIPVSIQIIQPAVKIFTTTLDLGTVCGCKEWDGWFSIPISTTSQAAEDIQVNISGHPELTLENSTVTVSPGQESIQLRLAPVDSPKAGRYQVNLALEGRAGLAIEPVSPIRVAYEIPSQFVRCQAAYLTAGSITLFAILLSALIITRIRAANRPALITGTLRHWPAGSSTTFAEIDLTALKKPVLSIGRNESCEIHIPDSSLADEHANLKVHPTNPGQRILLQPLSEAQLNNRTMKGETTLEHGSTFNLAQRTFQYLSDNPTP